jgi:hypothetical protein
MEQGRQALKKLNVLHECGKTGQEHQFSKARLGTLSDGIFGVAMTRLILDVRLPDDFHPRDAGELLRGRLIFGRNSFPIC